MRGGFLTAAFIQAPVTKGTSFKRSKLINRGPRVNLNLGEGFIDRKLETSIYPVPHLLLRPVLRADQHEPTIAALQSTRTVYYSVCGRELRALSWALDCYCTAEDQDKRKVVRFSAFSFLRRILEQIELCTLP